MKRSIWSLALLCAALGCGEDRGDPFAGDSGASLGAGGLFSGGSPGSGGNPGAGAGGIYGGSLAGGGTCASRTVQSGRVSPDILIVLDRSLSMKMNGVNRWDPSVAGLKAITSMLQDRVSFGLMTFPGNNAPAGDSRSCDPGSSRVPVARNSADMIAQVLDGTQPGGRTPTALTLKAAHSLIDTTRMTDPDSKAAPQYVLLVTDGAPNCTDPNGGGGGGNNNNAAFGSGEPAQVDASVAEIEAMTKAGIRTFVLGYDTQNDAALKQSLDRMAAAGGTGETMHRAIENQATLVEEFRQITEVALTCEFVLQAPVSDKKFVKVQIDGKQINVDSGDGWKLTGDNKVVTLQGDACGKVKQPGHVINVTIECTEVGIVD
jgi:hypothetical protein